MTSANTGLSPEWDRWFDEAFTDLIAHDEDLNRQEFDDLIGASWERSSPPPPPPAPPAPSTAVPAHDESTEGTSPNRRARWTEKGTDE